jgi:DNA-binding FrmR family transcriptional regulator
VIVATEAAETLAQVLAQDRGKLLNRARRIRGQVVAIEGMLRDDADRAQVLQTIAACRGAINGLMGQVIEYDVRFHVAGLSAEVGADQTEVANHLVDMVRTYHR